MLLSLSALFACSSKVPLELSIDPQTKSVIVVVENEDGDVAAHLSEHEPLREVLIPASARDRAEITVLTYSRTSEEMQIPPGTIAPSLTPRSRALPSYFLSAQTVVLQGDQFGDVSSIDAIDGLAATFRIAPFDPNLCADRGGCFLLDDPERRHWAL